MMVIIETIVNEQALQDYPINKCCGASNHVTIDSRFLFADWLLTSHNHNTWVLN